MDNSVDLQLLLEAGKNPPHVKVVSKAIQEEERLKAILESAYQYALKKGVEAEMKLIRNSINKNERNLDAIYNFNVLIINDRVIPPVITEARDLVQNKSYDSLNTTAAIYKIEKQASFSTRAPNWRQYLTFPESNYKVDLAETPTKSIMPKGSREKALWDEQTVKGFREGQQQAQNLFKHALNRLNTDYTGMVRFHTFVIEGKVSMPSITRKDLAITNSNSVMTLDQKLLQIRTLPSFDSQMLKWNTWLEPVQYNPSKQIATINSAD